MMLELFRRIAGAPPFDAAGLGAQVVARPVASGCQLPAPCTGVVVDAGGRTRRIGAGRAGTIRHKLRLQVPGRLERGDYHVIACLDRSRRDPGRARCLTGRHPLHVVPRRGGGGS